MSEQIYDDYDKVCACGHSRWAHHNFEKECLARKSDWLWKGALMLCECERFEVDENNSS